MDVAHFSLFPFGHTAFNKIHLNRIGLDCTGV